ncbi:sterol desaturase/sphingolipid hydroxylase (fatty acid hydroxylase superfamily) [Lewinella marina]|uniref:Sterol desaturase n=1 Tax=Neolewinella marina TaxID=438751 RepID=A0A2G0CGY9_9BACT|nr:sterol desaturase family protein [Neolewinella marina]NJB86340.1 sterol desaturase/sphingolipid hydroxylase (fatty acid hydroxylase superfamily) [Neolewinella marina]PHK99190.1 sterol desaturase [Neolewinella marina]
MEAIIQYFETIPSSHRTLILVGGLTLFWLVESAVPLFTAEYKRWRHAGINLFFTLTTVVVNFLLAFILVRGSQWAVAEQFGLLQWLNLPAWAMVVAGLPLLDLLGAYLPHWVQHRVPVLWKFHLIHHTDQNVDTTTANRHHPGESVVRFAFTTLGVVVLGAPIWLVFLYQSLSVIGSQFTHANITLPRPVDRVMRYIFVTPDMHRVHHHYVLPYTDSNYSNIFSFWDRLFGTYLELDHRDIRYGVDTHMEEEHHQSIRRMLGIPFERR